MRACFDLLVEDDGENRCPGESAVDALECYTYCAIWYQAIRNRLSLSVLVVVAAV